MLARRSLACLHSLSREILMALQGTEMRAEAALSLPLSAQPPRPICCGHSFAAAAVRLRRRYDRSESCYPSGANCTPVLCFFLSPRVTPRYILSTDARPNFPNFASRLGSWCSRQTVQVARAPHWLFKIIYDPGQGVSHKQQKSKDYCRAFP